MSHWEGELTTGRSNKSAIATLVERASGALMLVHLPGTHTTEVTVTALTTAFTALTAGRCRSLTYDWGPEMADDALLSAATGMPVFFADAHSPWQRGSNEYSNWLTRQYFARGPTSPCTHRSGSSRSRTSSRPAPKGTPWATPAARLASLQAPHA